MKQRILNGEEKELWDEFSKSTKPLRLQNKRNKKPGTIKTTKPKNHDLNKITSNVTDGRSNTKIIKDDKINTGHLIFILYANIDFLQEK